MSTAKITLRPPPNVEFVQGYPGIPPGAPDRPQAAVKGAVEVRLGPSGAKAKYVRVELRKIETLPSPPPNAFYSIVGSEAPTVLWQSSEEWGVLQSQDIPFHIRIPEAMPPSLSLEKGAGVKYELVGQVCVQGRTSFLRRSKPVIVSTSTPIVIDKHEFHSTWPYYQKPESRQLMHESVQLTVDRSQNCYGPGDRVSVAATIRSDALHTVILRGFEFTLKETTVYTAGLQGHSRKNQPQVKINIIGEQKLPVNATLYGGMTHRSDLSVYIPDSHTTTTINSAKHIDITYVLIVKALMGTGKPLIMELPVIVSNWPRNVSAEAIRRIGAVPSLSNQRPTVQSSLQRPITAPSSNQSFSSSSKDSKDPFRQTAATMPAVNGGRGSGSNHGHADELGARSGSTRAVNTAPGRQTYNTIDGTRRPDADAIATHGSGRRRSSAAGQTGRFAIVNAQDGEIPEEEDDTRHAVQTQQQAARTKTQWLSAEDEKTRLYEQAKANAERVQGRVERTDSLQSQRTGGNRTTTATSAPTWLTAEEEKVRLFNEAQNNARITQGLATAPAAQQGGHSRGGSRDSTRSNGRSGFGPTVGGGGQQSAVSAGAALYSAAISSVNKNASSPVAWSPVRNGTPPNATPVSTSPAHTLPGSGTARGQFPSAEEEKEMLRRYQEATKSVQRHQESVFGAQDTAGASGSGSYPAGAGSSSAYEEPPPAAGPPPPIDDTPPPWAPNANGTFDEGLSEKERYRRAYEAREAAAARAAGSPPPPSVEYTAPTIDYYGAPPPADYTAPPTAPYDGPPQNGYALQQQRVGSPVQSNGYAAQPNGYASAPTPTGSPPPPPASPWTFTPPPTIPPHLRQRAPPPAPGGGLSTHPLTAAEEKAMLRARYEEEERTNGSGPGTPPFTSSMSTESHASALATPPPPPPPLMPRPPAEYIQETREEDARGLGTGMGRVGLVPVLPEFDDNDTFGLKLRPSSPFVVGLDAIGRPASRATTNGPGRPPQLPPQLPPKVPL